MIFAPVVHEFKRVNRNPAVIGSGIRDFGPWRGVSL